MSGRRFAELAGLSRARLWAIAGLSTAFAVALVPLLATSDLLLSGLAARLEAIEGRLDIDSKPGRGTIVRASLPVA